MSAQPNRIDLTNGGYLLFDYYQGFYRVAIYKRHTSKNMSLTGALATALNLPPHNPKVVQMATYITEQLQTADQEITLV